MSNKNKYKTVEKAYDQFNICKRVKKCLRK